jgi:hypothetical protein
MWFDAVFEQEVENRTAFSCFIPPRGGVTLLSSFRGHEQALVERDELERSDDLVSGL